jgi:hypothetical protein
MEINGADVTTAGEAVNFLSALAVAYTKSGQNTDVFFGRQVEDGVTGAPLDFLAVMRDQAHTTANVFAVAARRAADQVNQINNTLGANPAIAGTQTGGYAAINA